MHSLKIASFALMMSVRYFHISAMGHSPRNGTDRGNYGKCVINIPRELILSASSLKTALYLTRAFSYSPFRNNFSPSAITAAGNI